MTAEAYHQSPVPILLMVRALALGGTERQVTEAALGLPKERFQVHVACFNASGLRAEELRRAGIPIVELPVRSFASPSVLRAVSCLRQYVLTHRIRLAHTFDVPLNVFGVPAARIARIPVVLASQRAHRQLSGSLYRRWQRLTDRWVDGIVVNCEAMRRHLIEDERVPPWKVHVCYNAIDTKRFHPEGRARRPELRDANLVIGSVSVLRPEKRLDTLLQAFACLRQSSFSCRLVIVGSGPAERQLRDLARSLRIEEECHFEPATREVDSWLRSIDIFVLPSESEALSNSLMEAMACGCGVVASHVGGNPELVTPGRTGWLFPPGDVQALQLALKEAASDLHRLKTFSHEGSRFIRQGFAREAILARLGDIYTKHLASRFT